MKKTTKIFKLKTPKRFRLKQKFFLRLRTCISKKILRFSKKRWIGLKRFISRKRYKFYNHSVHRLPRYARSLKKLYRIKLITKQRIKSYYGRLSNKQLKRMCKKTSEVDPDKHENITKESKLLILLEKRLEIVIFRAHFAKSVQSARQLITHGNILVNGKKVFNGNIIVNRGDRIEISSKVWYNVQNTVFKSRLWPVPPKHLEISYKILNIFLVEEIKFKNLQILFPFWLDLKTVLSYYRK
jgi:small subunit ribosomal protein S4